MSSALTLPSLFAHEGDPARAIAIRAREDCESRLRCFWPRTFDDQPNEKAIAYHSDVDSHNILSLEEEPSQAEQDFREKVGFYEAAALSLHYAGEDRGQRSNNFKSNVGIYDKRRKDLESELEHTTTYDVIEDVLNRLDESHCAANYRNASCSLYTDERDLERFNTRDGGGSRVSRSWVYSHSWPDCKHSLRQANTSTGPRTLTAAHHLSIQWQRFEKDGTMPTNLMARKAGEQS